MMEGPATEKLTAAILPPATSLFPIDRRKYTIGHSDETGMIYVSIGGRYDERLFNHTLKDEVLAEWRPHLGQYILNASVHISDGDFDENNARVRYLIFNREMKTALQAAFTADRELFSHFPWLLDSPVYICFQSIYPKYNKMKQIGKVRNFMEAKSVNL